MRVLVGTVRASGAHTKPIGADLNASVAANADRPFA